MRNNRSEVEIIIDSRLRGDGFKDTSRELGILDITVGNLVAGGLQSAAGLMIDAGAAALEWGRESAELGSNLLETESLLSNALGPAYQSTIDLIDDVTDRTGRSAVAFQQAISPIVAMTKAQGFAADEAGRLSTQFGEAAVDLNSYFNSATGFEDIQSALSGSAETLFKYGINAKEGALQQEALRLGIIETLGPLEQAERTTALLSLIQNQASDAMGDAARTADGYANTQRSTNEAIEEATAVIGVGITEAWKPWQDLINEMATEDLPEVTGVISKTLEGFGLLSKGFIQLNKDADTRGVLGDVFFAGLRGIAFTGELLGIKDLVEGLVEAGEQVEIMEERLARASERGGAGRGGGGISSIIDQNAIEQAIETANSFDQVLTTISAKTYDISNPFGNFDVSETDFDSFFGSIDTATQVSIDNVQNLGRAFSSVQEAINSLDTGNLVAQAGNTESGVIENVLGGLNDAGANVDTQAEFLREAGVGADTLKAKMGDLAEQAAADAALVAVELGASNESIFEFIEQAQEAADTAADPIEAVKSVIEEFQTSLSTLSEKQYPVNMSFSFEGQELLDDVYQKIQAITSADISTPNLDDAFNNAFGDGEAATNNRRQ